MLTDAQWGAALRWLYALSMDLVPAGAGVRMAVVSYEPTWWHRRCATRWGLRFRRRVKRSAELEE